MVKRRREIQDKPLRARREFELALKKERERGSYRPRIQDVVPQTACVQKRKKGDSRICPFCLQTIGSRRAEGHLPFHLRGCMKRQLLNEVSPHTSPYYRQ